MNSHKLKLAAIATGFLLLASACSGSDATPVAAAPAATAAPAPAEAAPTTAPVDTSSGSTTTTEAPATGAASATELVMTFADTWQRGDFAAMNSFASPAVVTEAERLGPIAELGISGGDACATDAGRAGSCELTVNDGTGGFLWLYRVVIDEQGANQSLRIAELIQAGDAG